MENALLKKLGCCSSWTLRTLCLLARRVRVTIGDSSLCFCVRVTVFRALSNSICLLILFSFLFSPKPNTFPKTNAKTKLNFEPFPCMVVWCTQNMRRNSISFMWHQPCNNQTAFSKYTPPVVIQNALWQASYSFRITRNKSAVSLLKSRERRYNDKIDRHHLTIIVLNPFTAIACKMSGQKQNKNAWMRLQTV